MKIFSTDLTNVSRQFTLRLDSKYREMWDKKEGNLFYVDKTIELGEVLEEVKATKFKKGELDNPYYIMNISDQEPKSIDIIGMQEVNEINSDKTDLSEAEIIISKLGLPKGYIYLHNKDKNIIGSTELIPYKCVSEVYNVKFLRYLLLTDVSLENLAALESGKTPSHKRVNPYDLLRLKIPRIDRIKQDNIVRTIETLENQIRILSRNKVNAVTIINEIFAKYYDLPVGMEDKFGKAMSAPTQTFMERKLKINCINFANISMSNAVRLSTRFHNDITKDLYKKLMMFDTIKLGSILATKVVRGLQPVVDENGEIPVIKTGQLKNRIIDLSEADMVNREFYEKKIRAAVQKYDILIASTGKGSLGKIDIVDFEEDALVDGHISIVRVDPNKYEPMFLLYFLRSLLGVFQIERDYTGSTNQIELNSSEIENFDIPNFSLGLQREIMNDIENKLLEQAKGEVEIKMKRREIEKLVENAVHSM